MGKYFGTDGIRGRVNDGLSGEMAFTLGMAAAAVLAEESDRRKPLLLIGKDTRISGSMLEAALAAGFASSGCDVLLLGVIPTPGVAALTRLLDADAAAVISASHNPYHDNGIKFFNNLGYKLPDGVEARIEALIDAPEKIKRALDGNIGVIENYPGAAKMYRDWAMQQLSPDLKSLRIVVDASNGATAAVAAEAFRQLGAEVISISDQPDGCNINDQCGSTHMEHLQKRVLAEKADLGLAFDGDADRMLAVDERGQLVDGDQIIAIVAAWLKERDELATNSVVITQMSNLGLRLAMEKLGIATEETKVGDRYVLERMLQIGAVVGGEQSGHIILSAYNSTGDGLVAALQLLAILVDRRQPLSQLAAVMQRLPQVLINVRVKDKSGIDTDADILAARHRVEEQLQGRGRLLLRPSGTESLIRVMAEGDDERELHQLVENLAALIGERLG
ncbi:MAG: phosphoglucosamine mutase [Bacillota bacterium]|nr:phosphoglucosamine mutase [Bacillota bacterium]